MRLSNRSGILKAVLITGNDVCSARLKWPVKTELKTLGIAVSAMCAEIHKLGDTETSLQ